MTIRIYPSVLPGEPVETHEASGSFGRWLAGKAPNYVPGPDQPISVEHNGRVVPPKEWEALQITGDIAIRVLPQGGGLGNILAIFLPFWFAPIQAFSALVPKIPNQGGAGGESIGLANAKANQARLGGVIPEIAGSPLRYPDYLLPPRRYFVDRREQWLEVLLCLGVGQFEIGTADVRIGDTPLLALGADATYTIYEPGDDLSGDTAAEWWHSADEVGNTSLGTAGLDLDATSAVEPDPDASAYAFSGDEIIIPSGSGEYPSGWAAGMLVRVEQYLDYQVSDATPRDVISGNLDQLAPFAGMVIEIAGENEGLYVIHDVVAATPPSGGSASTLTGSAAPARFDFDVTPASFLISLDGLPQSVSLTVDVTNMAGLLAAINGQLAGIVATESGGVIVLTEQGPTYSGGAITAGGSFDDILGTSPTGSAGTATTSGFPAGITLNFDDGTPVQGLVSGTRRMAISYRGLLWQITSAGTDTIVVDRLTDTGVVDASWPGFDDITTVDARLQLDGSTVEGGWAGPFLACPQGEQSDTLEVDFMMPGGLLFTGNKQQYPVTVTVEVQWREASNPLGVWSSQSFTYTDQTVNQLGFTERIALGGMMWPQVRVRRIGADAQDTRNQDTVQWYGLRSRLSAPTSYSGVTVISAKIRGGGRVAAQSENQINVRAARILPVYDGTDWATDAATRDIAPFARYIAHSIGYTDSQIDMTELERLHDVWSARGDVYDWVHDETTVRDAINQVLRSGMAVLTVDRGQIKPVRDEPRSEYQNLYTPQNMTSALRRSVELRKPDDADGVDVEFTEYETWTKQTVQCRLPGYPGIKIEKVTLDGVCDKTRAWRIGMRRLGELFWRRWQYRFDTELDALNSGYLNYDALADDIPGYGQSALIVDLEASSEGTLVTLSEPVRWEAGADHVLAFRAADGSLVGPYSATQVGEYVALLPDLEEPDWPEVTLKQELPHAVIGTLTRLLFPVLINSIKPNGMESTTVEAVNYDARVYQYDDSSPD